MATYLVTGGCGFIGSHLCAALLARGDHVRVLDNLSTGSVANLAPGAELLRGDVADPAVARAAMAGVEGCFHLAAIASVERGVREWLETHRTNLSGTIALFEAARLAGGGGIPVVYASSAAVYGEHAELPLHEQAPTRPISAYGADKLGCELHARVAGRVHGIPTMGLRFFNVFGPRQDPTSPYSGVISIFCDRLSRGETVDVFGDGLQTRDFVFVADVVAGLLAAMRFASPAAPVLNLCTGRPSSVLEVAGIVAELCEAPLRLRHRPGRAGEIRHSIGTPRQAREMLGLGEPAGLRDGLTEVVAWMRAGRPGLRRDHAARSLQSAHEPADDHAYEGPQQQGQADDDQRGGWQRQAVGPWGSLEPAIHRPCPDDPSVVLRPAHALGFSDNMPLPNDGEASSIRTPPC